MLRPSIALLALTITALPAVSFAQSYPTKPVHVVFPFQAGGVGDIVFRTLMPTLEHRLGQNIIFESRSGAGGNIGALAVAKAVPDGYTLLLPSSNVLVSNQF